MDPVGRSFESSYSVMGCNPIQNIDHKGDYWEEGSQEIADQSVDYANERISDLKERRDPLLRKREKLVERWKNTPAGEKKDKLFDRIGVIEASVDNINAQIHVLEDAVQAIHDITKSPVKFAFSLVSNNSEDLYTYWDVNSGSVLIEHVEILHPSDMGKRLHEIMHGGQIARGQVKRILDEKGNFLTQKNNGNLVYSLQTSILVPSFEEISCYQVQYAATYSGLPSSSEGYPTRISDITINWVYGITNSKGGQMYKSDIKWSMEIEFTIKRNY